MPKKRKPNPPKPTRPRVPKHRTDAHYKRGNACAYCGKLSYASRALAREAAKALYPSETMNAYQCLDAPEFVDKAFLWHVGHLPKAVVNGTISRDLIGKPFYPTTRKPVPPVLTKKIPTPLDVSRWTTEHRTSEDTNDEPGGTTEMTPIRDMASITVSKEGREALGFGNLTPDSPARVRAAYVHRLLLNYGIVSSFAVDSWEGNAGYVGAVNVRDVIVQAFSEFDIHRSRLDNFCQETQAAGVGAGYFKLIDGGGTVPGALPTWWISSSATADKSVGPSSGRSGPVVTTQKTVQAAPTTQVGRRGRPQKGVNPFPYNGRVPGSRNKETLETMAMVESVLKLANRPMVATEIHLSAPWKVSAASVRNAAMKLAKEGKLVAWEATDADRRSIKRRGGPRVSHNTQVFMHPLSVDNGVPKVATWGVKVEKSMPAPTTPAPALAVAPVPAPAPAPQPVSSVVAVETVDDADAEVTAVLERIANRSNPTQSKEYLALQEKFDAAAKQIVILQAENEKLKKTRGNLLAAIKSLEAEM